MNTTRITTIRGYLPEWDADALVLTNPANRMWATGFTSYATTGFSNDIAIISQDAVIIQASANNTAWARSESAVATEIVAHKGSFAPSLAGLLNERGFRRIAVEADSLPYSEAVALQSAFSGEITFVTGLRDRMRAAKDSVEQALLRRAAAITDLVFEEIAAQELPGQTESAVARRITARLIEEGDGIGFDVIVASGPNAARPHHRPGDRVIAEREPIVIDMGGRVAGYCGDLTRTLWFGEYDQQFESIYRAVLAAQIATKAALIAGAPAEDAANAADRSLQEAGYGEYILHSVGHGVGLDIHEAPWLRKDNGTILPIGAVVTVEPGLYIPEWGGVRIEDVVIVGDGSCETITFASKVLI